MAIVFTNMIMSHLTPSPSQTTIEPKQASVSGAWGQASSLLPVARLYVNHCNESKEL